LNELADSFKPTYAGEHPLRLANIISVITDKVKSGGPARARAKLRSMYLAVDIGGTKTLLAAFDSKGKIQKELKFPTPQNYETFLTELDSNVKKLGVGDFRAAAVAVPGLLNRETGKVLALGNLPWKNEPIEAEIERLVACPVIIENDAKLAGLSEAKLLIKDFKRTIYITISTGIGIALITDGIIDTKVGDLGGRGLLVEHNEKLVPWESFASGKAIFEKYGKRASDITDEEAWKLIAHNLAIGFIDLIAVLQPDVIVVGGGVGAHYKKFEKYLLKELKSYEVPMLPIPPIRQAQHAEEAVIYGCYELVKEKYGNALKTA